MDRINLIQHLMTEVIAKIDNEDYKRFGYSHLFGVSGFASMLAGIRGFDENDIELLAISGLLHDIAVFIGLGRENHGQKGAEYLKELLPELKVFSDEEVEKICTAISLHSDKKNKADAFSEVLKDADVLDHYYSNVNQVIEKEIERLLELDKELGLNINMGEIE